MNFLNLPQRWLDAEAGKTSLQTLPSLMTLCDLQNDNYYKLIAADIPRDLISSAKIKVFKGTILVGEQKLQGTPVAVQSLYIDDNEPKVPIVAVAVGSSILFYRNMKPYFKYTLPGLTVEEVEIEVWKKLTLGLDSIQKQLDILKTIGLSKLTEMSQKFLHIPAEEQEDFVKKHLETPLERFNNITAMTKINKFSNELKSAACLIIGTESGDIIILDSLSFTILYQVKVCSFKGTPSIISASGLYETDFKIVVATMEGTLCLLRKNGQDGNQIVKLDDPASGLVLLPIDQTIAVVCMNKSLICYSKKGKKLWSAMLPSPAICLTAITLPELTLICVSLYGGMIQIYLQKNLVDQFYVHDNVSAMIFGKLGLEDHVLVLATLDGSLIIKILKRQAEFSIHDLQQFSEMKPKDDVSVNFNIPKKSSVFVEQTIRERDNLSLIHNAFQTELWRLRLTAARKTVDIINSADSTISGDSGHSPIKLAAEVLGVGPVYRLFLKIENISERKEAGGLSVLLHADHRHYNIEKRYAKLPLLIPGIPLKIDFKITIILDPTDKLPSVDLNSENSIIRVMIIANGQSRPLIASTVVMPQPEFAFFDE